MISPGPLHREDLVRKVERRNESPENDPPDGANEPGSWHRSLCYPVWRNGTVKGMLEDQIIRILGLFMQKVSRKECEIRKRFVGFPRIVQSPVGQIHRRGFETGL